MTDPVVLRVDKWLWHARLVKTRSLAARLCEAGLVEIRDAVAQRPAQPVKVGDHLVIRHANWVRRIEILGLGTRRGPATEARLLYRELEARRLAQTDEWVPLLDQDGDEDSPDA